jgi:hypothetical protein
MVKIQKPSDSEGYTIVRTLQILKNLILQIYLGFDMNLT